MRQENQTQPEEPITSLGKRLALLRQNMGLSIDDIASKIHVRKAIIVSLEEDRSIDTPTVFLKGYIRAYAEIVNLPLKECEQYFATLTPSPAINIMKNYSHKEQNKRKGKRLIYISLIILICIIGATLFFVWKDNKSHLVEVNHYISSPQHTLTTINS